MAKKVETKSGKLFGDLGEILSISRKLNLDEKTEVELREMLCEHKNSFYKRFCDYFGIRPSSYYLSTEWAINTSIKYREYLKYTGNK